MITYIRRFYARLTKKPLIRFSVRNGVRERICQRLPGSDLMCFVFFDDLYVEQRSRYSSTTFNAHGHSIDHWEWVYPPPKSLQDLLDETERLEKQLDRINSHSPVTSLIKRIEGDYVQ